MQTIIWVVFYVVLAIVITLEVKSSAAERREYNIEEQQLVREIRDEASKKNLNAESMIVNALKRVLENIKSL